MKEILFVPPKVSANILELSVVVIVLLGISQITEAGTIVGKVEVFGARDSADAVVYLEAPAPINVESPKEHALLDQFKKEFIPHILPVLKGTTVDFLNSDEGLLHNIHAFWLKNKSTIFNIAMPFKGMRYSRKFDETGEVLMLCDIHREMSAYILVLPSPYFAKTDKNGDFVLENVPSGKYKLKTWHEARKSQLQEIVVEEGKKTEVKFVLKKK